MTQNNLGLALLRLGGRKSGTARLGEAAATYREASTIFLVLNVGDHHLYDWWIDPVSHALQGEDLGAAWNNVQFLASGHFGNTNEQFLVRNTVDSHLYVWWITQQHTLVRIDLGAQLGIELVDTGHFNNANGSATNDECWCATRQTVTSTLLRVVAVEQPAG
jgi:hypothetical protein